ncbi:MAG: phosphatase PAP2 family protein [Flavobacteriia bacterium]|nr:phosphatase PAP2 family protein [Flavobacteriia bacterium]
MIDFLEKIDHYIVLSVNGCYTPILGQCMWFLSGKFTWIPLYILLAYLAFSKLNRKQFYLFLFSVIVIIALSDLTCTYGFKYVFQRYRPSHNFLLESKLHFYEITKGNFYKGAKYGFISSHAANFFGFAIFIGLALKKQFPKLIFILLFIAILVSFSRLFLGVHYLSDLLVGAAIGTIYSLLIYKLIFLKYFKKLETK